MLFATVHESESSQMGSLPAGHCPHCRLQFTDPLALPCGHSVCQVCCNELLKKCNATSEVTRRYSRRSSVRMGLNVVGKLRKKSSTMSLGSVKEGSSGSDVDKKVLFLSPRCPVCDARPKFTPPIRNYALEKLIKAHNRFCNSKSRSSLFKPEFRKHSPTPSSTSSSGFDELEERASLKSSCGNNEFSIRKCNIVVLGAPGVGTSRLARAQHLNKLFFGRMELDGENDYVSDIVDCVADLQAKYMIEILDNNDMDGDLHEADGIILAYASNSHESLVAAFKIYSEIKQRGFGGLPLILVDTKCDVPLERREVESEEAESLARHIGCPHIKISVKKNIGVNEAFTQLVRLIEANVQSETLQVP